ncbi:nucleotidyltransferase family protein [Corallococcus exiguus]|uniref:nucleotidyltransferase domain-containing protein n=1 Tax=Corallococcus exiguus TaxID=83462 RepID=UPI001A8EE561|nr:nucleotidyltransferase family protein [Corallococcus exiguus]MBN8469752.1 nucleotidyltransferase family protein [Corallococcus exiguus]
MDSSPALLTLLHAWPEVPDAPGPSNEGDGEVLVKAAVRHGLAGFVEHALAKADWTLTPDAAALLTREARLSAARGMRVRSLLSRSLTALAALGLTPVLLKGYGLARRLYPEPLQRATNDVDLLVPRARVLCAVHALEGMGLTTQAGGVDRDDAHHVELTGPDGLVELHYRALTGYGLSLEGDAMVSRALDATLDGHPVRYLCPEDEAVYLSLHASNHLLQRLAWLFDLKLLARANPRLDWDRVVTRARRTELPHLVWYAWDAAHRLLDAPVPAWVLKALAPPRWQRALATRLFSGPRLVDAELAKNKPAWVAAKLALAPRARPMVRYALRRLRGARPPPGTGAEPGAPRPVRSPAGRR